MTVFAALISVVSIAPGVWDDHGSGCSIVKSGPSVVGVGGDSGAWPSEMPVSAKPASGGCVSPTAGLAAFPVADQFRKPRDSSRSVPIPDEETAESPFRRLLIRMINNAIKSATTTTNGFLPSACQIGSA